MVSSAGDAAGDRAMTSGSGTGAVLVAVTATGTVTLGGDAPASTWELVGCAGESGWRARCSLAVGTVPIGEVELIGLGVDGSVVICGRGLPTTSGVSGNSRRISVAAMGC